MVGFWLTIALLGLLPKVASGSSHGDLPGLYVLSQPCQSWFISSGYRGTLHGTQEQRYESQVNSP